jgi:hypothetical protein
MLPDSLARLHPCPPAGALLDSTSQFIARQADATVGQLDRLVKEALDAYPQLDPKVGWGHGPGVRG